MMVSGTRWCGLLRTRIVRDGVRLHSCGQRTRILCSPGPATCDAGLYFEGRLSGSLATTKGETAEGGAVVQLRLQRKGMGEAEMELELGDAYVLVLFVKSVSRSISGSWINAMDISM